jgi:hypothetical protein
MLNPALLKQVKDLSKLFGVDAQHGASRGFGKKI